MKILILWNSDASTIKETLKSAFEFQFDIRLEPNEISVISNKSDYTKFLNSLCNSKIYVPDHIFILVELNWYKNKKITGYEIAAQLMKSTLMIDKGIDLQFVSTYSRDHLHNKNIGNTVNLYLIKVFEHSQYPETKNFVFNECSVNIWNYYRKHLLSKSLFLANIKHRLDNVSIEQVIPELTLLSDILDKETRHFIDHFNRNLKTEFDKEELKLLLENRINELNNELIANSEKKTQHFNVLIIEDDEVWLQRLESTFKSRYVFVKCLTKGEDALIELKENGNRYDILISDLELLDKNSGFKYNQRIMGYHVIEFAQRYYKHITIRIITSLSSIGIDILFPENNFKILPKRNFTFINEDYFNELETDVVLASKRNRNKKGPQISIWIKKRSGGDGLLSYYYNILTDNERNEIWNYAYMNLQNLRNIDGGISPKREEKFLSEPKESIINGLKIICTNRLYWISKGYELDGVLNYEEPLLNRLDNRNQTAQMGFTVRRPRSQNDTFNEINNYYRITFDFLFPEEIFWLKNKGIILKFEQSYFEETINDICDYLILEKPKCNPSSYIAFLGNILNQFHILLEPQQQIIKGYLKLFKDQAQDEWIDLDITIRTKILALFLQ